MTTSIERRLEKIEQKVGSDTTVIRSRADFTAYTVKVIQGIPVGKVTFGPECAKWVEIMRRAAQAQKESEDNEH